MLGNLFGKKKPKQDILPTQDVEAIRKDAYNQGFSRGTEFMKNRYVAFMKETQLMVENDEMELIEVIGVENGDS